MKDIESADIKEVFFEMMRTKFAGYSFWNTIEPQVAIFCSDLVDPTTAAKTRQFVKQVKSMKDYFIGQDIIPSELSFLDEEIDRHEQTKTITLYEEEEDEVDPKEIEYYSRHGGSTEGVVGIHLPYNYSQLKKLTNGVFKKTGLIKFYISKEKTIYGKIVAEIYEHSQEIPIASLIESKKSNKETGEPNYRGISLFGQKISHSEFITVKEINTPFYVYRFITEKNKEMILMSPTQCEIGDYIVTGVMTICDDYKMLTDSARLQTKLPFLFAQKVMNRIIKFKNHEEFKTRLNNLKINRENFSEYPFTIKKNGQAYELLNPPWYKSLIWAWLTHQPKGLFNNYPMHLMVMGPKHSGKSLQLNGLHAKSKETRSIFSGSSSTLKSLVPSFKYNPARLGYLAESNRFSFCDEFFRCLLNTRTTKDGSQREESVAMMNDLLEHQKREAGSGVSRVNVNMTARIIATTNPIRGMSNVTDLINSFDESFLSRWIIYYQTDDHVAMVRHSRDSNLKKYNFGISDTDWIAILDYLHTFSAEYDMDRVMDIHASVPSVLNETLNRHYDARHDHHIECLMDGIIKSRCLLDKDIEFKATEDDYKNLKIIWSRLIGSWINLKDVRYLDIKEKINYMPERCQYIFWKIVGMKRPVVRKEIQEMVITDMGKNEFFESWGALVDNELINESNGVARPYFMEERSDETTQQRL